MLCNGSDVATTTTVHEYDNSGNMLWFVDANDHAVEYVYDSLNRRTTVIYPDGTEQVSVFDARSRRVAAVDQAGVTTFYGYDALGRLTAVTNALNGVTSYAYDELGRQVEQIDALGRTTSFEYDALGRRVKRILPEGQVESVAYNAVGLPISRTDFNGKTTTFEYDAMNRLTAKVPDVSFGAPSVMFGYDARGLRTSMTDAHGMTTYSYNERGLRTQKASPNGTLDYSYDAQGNLKSTESGNANGLNLTYNYDALNRLRDVINPSTGLTRYTYDAVGSLESIVSPNGMNHVYGYDSQNRLTDLTVNALTTPIRSYAYTLAPTGHRLGVAESTGRTVSYQYDDLYRLKQETVVGVGYASYVLDAVGNRLSRTSNLFGVPNQSFSYNDNDWLDSDTYDDNGNTVSADGHSDEYDFENRLLKRTTASGDTIEITYDGDGNRVQKRVDGIPKWYLVDDHNLTGYAQVVEELATDLSGGLAVNAVYTYGHDLISQERFDFVSNAWKTHYYAYDGHGNVRFLTDSTGAITDTYDYDAFGLLINQQVYNPVSGFLEEVSPSNQHLTTINHYLYCGEQYDSDLGMYFLRARYMEPDRGRFWTMDTYEGRSHDPISLHKYLYANSDPVNYADPSGMFSLSEMMATVSNVGSLAKMAIMGVRTWAQAKIGLGVAGLTQYVIRASAGIQNSLYSERFAYALQRYPSTM